MVTPPNQSALSAASASRDLRPHHCSPSAQLAKNVQHICNPARAEAPASEKFRARRISSNIPAPLQHRIARTKSSDRRRASTKSTGVLLLVPRKASQISDNAFPCESTKRRISPKPRPLRRAVRMVNGRRSRSKPRHCAFLFPDYATNFSFYSVVTSLSPRFSPLAQESPLFSASWLGDCSPKSRVLGCSYDRCFCICKLNVFRISRPGSERFHENPRPSPVQ